jgi:hypothetical protein
MPHELIDTIILVSAVILSFAVSKIDLQSYEFPIAIILFICLFLVKRVIFPKERVWKIAEAFIFILITLFTVLTTGGIHSPFFFLIYFLLFSLSMLFEPMVSLTISMIIILIFIITTGPDVPFRSLIPIFSLAFLSPFALLLSQERIEIEKLKLHDKALKENTFLFLSLTLKKHLNSIMEIAENIRENHQSQGVKKQVKIIEKLIERYEEQ